MIKRGYFNTTTIKFTNRIKFELAVDIIWVLQRKLNKHICDIGYADMVISVFEPSGFEDIKSEFLKYFGDMSVCEIIKD